MTVITSGFVAQRGNILSRLSGIEMQTKREVLFMSLAQTVADNEILSANRMQLCGSLTLYHVRGQRRLL